MYTRRWTQLATSVVVGATLLLAAAVLLAAQAPPSRPPFAVGEELVFKAHFGGIPAGTARMKVEGIDTVRGRSAYHVSFAIDGGIIGFRIHDRYESWMDVATLSSLRHTQRISEGRYHRNTTYEIYPEQAMYRKNDDSLQTSVENPLDDGSFVYAVRAMIPSIGDTLRIDRYFRPDRNPVVLAAMRRDTVNVGAGTFAAIVVRPSIRANGIFSDKGDAEIWFSDDERRIPVRIKSHFARFSLSLSLHSYLPGGLMADSTTPR